MALSHSKIFKHIQAQVQDCFAFNNSLVVEDDQGTQLWYKGSFLLLGTKFNGEQYIQNPKNPLRGKIFIAY